MHFDVAAASPKPGSASESHPEQTSANPEARGSAAVVPARSSPQRDEGSKTKDYCKVRGPTVHDGRQCERQWGWVSALLLCLTHDC